MKCLLCGGKLIEVKVDEEHFMWECKECKSTIHGPKDEEDNE